MFVMAMLDGFIQMVQALETEILVFLLAICTHALLFRKYRFAAPKKRKPLNTAVPGPPEGRGQGATPPRVPGLPPLLKAVKPLLHGGADRSVIAREFKFRLQDSSPESVDATLVALLDALGKAVNSELLAAVRTVLTERALQASSDLSERLLRGYLSLRLMSDFKSFLEESEAAHKATPGILMIALRSAIFSSDLDGAVLRLRSLSAAWQATAGKTPSAAPQYLVQQLARLALDKTSVPMILRELSESGLLNASALEVFLQECAQRRPSASLQEVEKFARGQGVALSAPAYGTLIRSVASAEDARRLFAEALERGLATAKDVVLAVAEAALAHGDESLAASALRVLPASPAPEVAAAMLRLCAKGLLQGTSVLELYQKHLADVDLLVNIQAGRLVAEAAEAEQRPDLLAKLLAASPETSRQVALLKCFATEHRLPAALAVFEACSEKSACHYNTLLDVCIDSGDKAAVERVTKEAIAARVADVVTYNTMIKAHLRNNDLRLARSAMEAMRAAGLAPNSVTFNELIDATIKSGKGSAWTIIEEMQQDGVRPNHVTCSILLKSIQQGSRAADVERTLEVIQGMEEGADEVLLSSVCEACMRVGRADLLTKQLEQQRSGKAVEMKGAHSYGTLIRSFGFIQDMAGAWEMWREMRANHIVPTAITIGCMVEALVLNGDAEAGHRLIHEVLGDDQTRPLVNAVMYCSVLKGFCHEKRFDRVWSVYSEMVAAGIEFSIVTYNALIDACARNGDMARVQPLLEDMHRHGIEPNVITYSTILKGYCQEHPARIDKAFELLAEMKKSACFHPDEITYNTLLDGCARYGYWERGIGLLEDMQEAGVAPSNFTLSVLVKLATRSKRPQKAFELCDELCKKYHLRPNVHVYNNLVHACTGIRDTRRALEVFEEMVGEKVRPDTRTYTLLIKACLLEGEGEDAAGLLRAAVGTRGAHPRFARFEKGLLQLRGGLTPEFIAEALEGLARQCGDEQAAMQLLRDLRQVPGLKLDSKLQLKLASQAIKVGS